MSAVVISHIDRAIMDKKERENKTEASRETPSDKQPGLFDRPGFHVADQIRRCIEFGEGGIRYRIIILDGRVVEFSEYDRGDWLAVESPIVAVDVLLKALGVKEIR